MSINDPPMSLWMRKFVLEWLSYKLNIRRKGIKRRRTLSSHSYDLNEMQFSEVTYNEHKNKNRANSLPFRNGIYYPTEKISLESRRSSLLLPGQMMIESETKEISQKLDVITEKLTSDEHDLLIKDEWRICALTIDRLLLISFFCILIVTILACLLSAPGYVP